MPGKELDDVWDRAMNPDQPLTKLFAVRMQRLWCNLITTGEVGDMSTGRISEAIVKRITACGSKMHVVANLNLKVYKNHYINSIVDVLWRGI